MINRHRFAGILVFFLLYFCASLNPAYARVVAILFDDSGSMTGKDNLPSFGAQLLISTLDGRNGTDKLLTAKMSDFLDTLQADSSIRQLSIESEDQQRQAIKTVDEQWRSIPDSGTPHHQIEAMLGRIAAIQSEGEEAFLIIVSDGFFNTHIGNTTRLPGSEDYRESIKGLKSDLKGPLRVEFMLIGPNSKSSKDQNKTVADEVESQGIRKALLEILNESSSVGKVDVYTTDNLVSAFRSIIARVASTEIDGLQKYISKSTDVIQIESPLSIKRIVSVSVENDDKELTQPLSDSIPVTDSFSMETAMPNRDTDPGWIGSKLHGLTTHFLMDPPLPAGSHRIQYSGDVSNVFLLFQSTAGLELSVIDQSGEKIAPNSNGVIAVSKGSTARLALEIVDQSPSGPQLVQLNQLGPNLKLSSRYDDENSVQKLDVNMGESEYQALASLPTHAIGDATVTADMRIKGFVSAYANPLKISIVDTKANISLTTSGLSNCDGEPCREHEIGVVLSQGSTSTELSRVSLIVDTPIDGVVSLNLVDAIPEMSLARGATDPQNISVSTGENRIDFSLNMDGLPIDTIRRNNWRLPVKLEAKGTKGLEGNTSHEIFLVFTEPQAKLVFTGHSQDASGQNLLKLGIKSLKHQEDALDFILYDALDDNATQNITVDLDHPFLKSTIVSRDASKISISPSHYPFCGCFISLFGQGEYKATVSWNSNSGKISTTATSPYAVHIPFKWAGGLECLKLLGGILLIIYLLVALAYWIRAETFPRGSGLDIQYNNEDPTFRELHRFNWTFAKALIWPIFGVPDEKRLAEGVMLIATRGGAKIALTQSNPGVRLESIGETIGEIVENNPDLQTYKMPWGDAAERKGLGDNMRMNLLSNVSDRHTI